MKINNLVKGAITRSIAGRSNTERAVEIPFLFEVLLEPSKDKNKTKVLDVGCAESSLVVELNKLGFDSYGIDLRPYIKSFVNFVRCDARNMKFTDDTFDVCYAISTIEHVGLVETPYRTDKVLDKYGDKKVVSEMVRVTKPEGMIIITLPYGKGTKELSKWVRFYNKDRINSILPNNMIIDNITYSIRKGRTWSRTSEQIASATASQGTLVYSNICILGHKQK